MSAAPTKQPNAETRDSADQETEPLQVQDKEDNTRARYHRYAIFLLVVYIPLITVPWALTCVLSKRPLGASSYHIQRGFIDKEMRQIKNWTTAINVLNSISSLVTIPILSALIAQAAVVYSERHETRQDFRVKHLVALADRGWTNPFILGNTWTWKGQESVGVRNLLHFAAIVILLGSLQQPLYQILAPVESMLVPTCQDTYPMRYVPGFRRSWGDCKYNPVPPRVIGWDMEPEQIAITPLDGVVQQLVGEMATAGVTDGKPNLWANMSTPEPTEQVLGDLKSESFVATLTQGTTTGVLREHVMRMNSSVSCQRIPRSEFPSVCTGEHPFTISFQHGGNFTKVCVPGFWGSSPWTQSRSRQDISEDLFLDILEQLEFNTGYVDEKNYTSDYTLHCSANTTRGYFELGNYRNNYTWGPLLEQWPSAEELTKDYNDFKDMKVPEDSTAPAPKPDLDYEGTLKYVSGPLTTAAIAIFGNNTFFNMGTKAWSNASDSHAPGAFSWDQVCAFLPFAQLNPPGSTEYPTSINRFPPCEVGLYPSSSDTTWREALAEWLHGFNDTGSATTAMSTAVYLTNQAVLTADKWNTNYKAGGGYRADDGRTIYSGSGTTIRKPDLSVASIIVISCIIFFELVALGLLVWLIYRGPSKTRSLDALAFSQLKRNVEDR